MGVSDKDMQVLRSRAASMDARRERQIQNQIASINRLLKGGTYDTEMQTLHEQLATTQADLQDSVVVLKEAKAVLTAVQKWRGGLGAEYSGPSGIIFDLDEAMRAALSDAS